MKAIKILIIGKNSFLANNYKNNTKIKNLTLIDRSSIDSINLEKYTHIINFSLDPKVKKKDYNLTYKLDKKICYLIKNKNIIYVLPSSRAVYSEINKIPYKENCIKKYPNGFYGKNKLKIEKDVKKIINKNYLIIRIPTLLIFDVSKRNLFISRILFNLKKLGKINFDIKSDTFKDFITIEYFSFFLDKLIKKRAKGTYNLSFGKPVLVKQVANNIISGFGKGLVKYTRNNKVKKNQSFVLNNKKIKQKINFSVSKKYILKYCRKLGKSLNYE